MELYYGFQGFHFSARGDLVFTGRQIYLNRPNHHHSQSIDHFKVVCSMTWPSNGSEAGGHLVFKQTSLLLLCKSSCSNANHACAFTWQNQRGLYQSKITSNLTTIQRPAHWEAKCKMVHLPGSQSGSCRIRPMASSPPPSSPPHRLNLIEFAPN